MDLPWGDERTTKFITNVGLITSYGKYGNNIMACEWTHHISYSPGLIAVAIGHNKATSENIKSTKQFGVSLASLNQNILASVAGTTSGKNVDKINILKELGYQFYNAKKIKTLMVQDAALNIECSLIKIIKLGDHTLFIGEVLLAEINSDKEPLAYHNRKYFALGKNIERPNQEKLEEIRKIIEKHRKNQR